MAELEKNTYGEKLKNLLNEVFHGIVLINDNFIVKDINGSACNMLGDTESNIINQSFLNYVSKDCLKEATTYLNQCKSASNQTFSIQEFKFKNKKEYSMLEIDFNHFFIDVNDNQVYSIGVLYDVTEKVELEDEVETQVKHKRNLQKKLEKELELSDMKSRFISIASHEFRTPLAGILSSIDLAERYVSSEPEKWNEFKHKNKVETHFESIKKSVSHLTITLNQFLSLGKLEEGKIEYTPTLFNIENVINTQIKTFDGLKKEEQTITSNYQLSESMVYLDENIFRNVINNLLSNAIKYTPAHKNIWINVKQQSDLIDIEIKDEGCGIPDSEQKNMFRRFFRAKNVENIQGTGLGLNIVKRYMELMNGTITFKSKENEGTTFYLKLNHRKS